MVSSSQFVLSSSGRGDMMIPMYLYLKATVTHKDVRRSDYTSRRVFGT